MLHVWPIIYDASSHLRFQLHTTATESCVKDGLMKCCMMNNCPCEISMASLSSLALPLLRTASQDGILILYYASYWCQ